MGHYTALTTVYIAPGSGHCDITFHTTSSVTGEATNMLIIMIRRDINLHHPPCVGYGLCLASVSLCDIRTALLYAVHLLVSSPVLHRSISATRSRF